MRPEPAQCPRIAAPVRSLLVHYFGCSGEQEGRKKEALGHSIGLHHKSVLVTGTVITGTVITGITRTVISAITLLGRLVVLHIFAVPHLVCVPPPGVLLGKEAVQQSRM